MLNEIVQAKNPFMLEIYVQVRKPFMPTNCSWIYLLLKVRNSSFFMFRYEFAHDKNPFMLQFDVQDMPRFYSCANFMFKVGNRLGKINVHVFLKFKLGNCFITRNRSCKESVHQNIGFMFLLFYQGRRIFLC
jgi:hypothetical protein